MKTQSELLKHSGYLRELKPLLPPGAFQRNPRKLMAMALHVLIVAGCVLGFRQTETIWLNLFFTLVMGHSIACLGFYAHDLSHKTILPSGVLLRVLELIIWTIAAVPATVWRRVHNATHHHETNTVGDPDRWFLRTEQNAATTIYTRVFYPHHDGLKYNPAVALHFIAYVLRNSIAAFGFSEWKPSLVPARPSYTNGERLSIVFEIALLLIYQFAVFISVGGAWEKFFWASPASYAVTSAFVMGYIFTNHSLNPLCEHTDPVTGSTSVEVPAVCNLLHSNFSFHTEHHLFPGMDSSHYPSVAELLQSKFPHRYNRMSIAQAWKQLWKTDGFLS